MARVFPNRWCSLVHWVVGMTNPYKDYAEVPPPYSKSPSKQTRPLLSAFGEGFIGGCAIVLVFAIVVALIAWGSLLPYYGLLALWGAV